MKENREFVTLEFVAKSVLVALFLMSESDAAFWHWLARMVINF